MYHRLKPIPMTMSGNVKSIDKIMNGILYIVATPIGNMEDMTGRAKRILGEADIVASEDTRTTQKLLSILGIKNKTVSNHKFNEKKQSDYLITALEEGKNVAIVSDAGTPCISDPGGIIIRAAVEHGITVEAIPGASSVVTALSICGFDHTSFSFHGFLPKEAKEIKKIIKTTERNEIPINIYFESPKRIKKTIKIFADEIPNAEICLCNDLTKKFERTYRGKPQNILTELQANPSSEKGEYTIVTYLTPTTKNTPIPSTDPVSQQPETLLTHYLVKNNVTIKEAINTLALQHKGQITKKEFYTASLNLKRIFNE